MRHSLLLILAAVLALLLSAPIASADSRPDLGCVRHGNVVTPVEHPRTCNTWYPWLAHYQSSGLLYKLHWRHWGRNTATATGRGFYSGMGPTYRVRIRVYRIRCIADYPERDACAYTRLYIRTAAGHGVQKLPWGYDLWPEY